MDLTGTWFEGVEGGPLDFTDADVAGCTFGRGITKEHLVSTRNYRQRDLSRMRLYNIDLSGLRFSGFDLTGCTFSRCNFSGATLEDAVVTGLDVSQGNAGITPDQIKSTWNYKHGRMEGIRLPKHIADALMDERAPQ